MSDMRGTTLDANLDEFRRAGMLSKTAVSDLTKEQRKAIESWKSEDVELIIRLYQDTGEIKGGVCWI